MPCKSSLEKSLDRAEQMLGEGRSRLTRSAHVGKFRVPVAVALELAGHLAENELSARELDVLRLVAIGSSTKRVGQLLKVTEDTVKAHMKAILAKLGAGDRTHAVTLAMRRGIIDP